MGRVTQSGCDSIGGQRKNNIREEQRVRAKKKRRKKELIDLHCGLRKPGKRNRKSSYWQSNFVKLLHRFADIREEYGKETKIDGDLGRARNSKKISNRILARPVSGIYRNGAVSKEIRRSQNHVLLGDTNNARLEGNVMKLLQGYDTNAKCIVIDDDREQPKDILLDPIARNILHPTPPSLHSASPILGKVDGKKRYVRDEQEHAGPSSCADVPGLVLEKKKVVQPTQDSAIRRYEELCATVCTEFEGLNLPEQLTTDPLSSVKKKLRSVYAESFHNQFLKDMIKRGQILNERPTPSPLCSNPILPEAVCSSSGYGESCLIAGTVDTSNPHDGYEKAMKQVDSQANRNPFVLPERKSSLLLPKPAHREKRKEVSSPTFIFGSSLMSPHSSVDKIESERRVRSENSRFVENIQSNSSLEVICPLSLEENQKCLDDEMVTTMDMPVRQRDRKALLFTRSIAEMLRESVSTKPLVKRKNQRTQTTNVLNSRTKRHPGKGNAKATHQVNTRNLKHVPAILRRCNKVNLFDPPTEKTLESTQPNVLYTPLRFALKNSRDDVCNSDTSVLNVQTCVVASPSLRKDLGKISEGEPDHSRVNNIFQKKSKKNPMVQKTVMFTKKDSHNRYLHLNDLVGERSVDSSNVCRVRQEASQHQEKCVDCQRAAPSCYQSFYCSEKSNDSNYYSQELKEVVPQARPLQVQQEPVVCEKLFVRKLQQHPNKNHTVCFVAVDRGEELDEAQDCGNIPPEKHYCQDDVADVGILNGVQSLKIFPMEDQRAKCTTQCIGNTVVLEEQPVKYLAFDDDSQAHRIPIYVQSKQRPQFTSVDNADANPKINYRLVSCPSEPAQKILLVPSHEQNKVVYVKEKNRPGVSYEKVNQPRKMFFYRPSSQSEAQCEQNSNTCEVHVSKQNLVQIANARHENISGLQQTEPGTKMRKSFSNWEEVHYRPSHEHTAVKDACTKTVYFK